MDVVRTDQEIIERIRAVDAAGGIDFAETSDLVCKLSIESAREFLKPDVAEWNVEPRDEEHVKAQIVKYLDFAWEKCRGERGLSAIRSIHHFKAWTWLLGDEEAFAFLDDDDNYGEYGEPMLTFLQERYVPKVEPKKEEVKEKEPITHL